MPKPFTAFVDIEQSLVGVVLSKIKNMRGVVGVGIDDGKPRYKNGHDTSPDEEQTRQHREPRGPRKLYETTGKEDLIKMMTGKPPMTTKQMADGFVARGRSPKSINSLCHVMKNEGELVLTNQGWALSKKLKDRLRHRKTRR